MNSRTEQAEREQTTAPDVRLADVTLVATVDDERVDVPGLALAFDKSGFTVRKPTGALVVEIPWVLIRAVSAPSDHRAARGIVDIFGLIVQTDRRRHRFVIRNANPQVLTASLAALSFRYTGRDLTRVDRSR